MKLRYWKWVAFVVGFIGSDFVALAITGDDLFFAWQLLIGSACYGVADFVAKEVAVSKLKKIHKKKSPGG